MEDQKILQDVMVQASRAMLHISEHGVEADIDYLSDVLIGIGNRAEERLRECSEDDDGDDEVPAPKMPAGAAVSLALVSDLGQGYHANAKRLRALADTLEEAHPELTRRLRDAALCLYSASDALDWGRRIQEEIDDATH